MHSNKAFRQKTRESNVEFARERSFGALSINADPSPLISHIPFQLSADGQYLEAHLVRSNPIVRLLEEPQPAVIAVTGADGYISPDWYQLDNQVPTWNYVAVHIRGQLRLLEQSALREILVNLSANLEQRLVPKAPWTLDKLDDSVFDKLAKQIVPVAVDVAAIDGTWKLAQNKPADARLAAAAELAQYGIGLETGILAQLMQHKN